MKLRRVGNAAPIRSRLQTLAGGRGATDGDPSALEIPTDPPQLAAIAHPDRRLARWPGGAARGRTHAGPADVRN